MTWRTSQPVSFRAAEAECSRLREENANLRRLLAEHNILIPPAEPPMRPFVKPLEASFLDERQERARKRIVLFRSLFRGIGKMSTRADGRTQADGQDTR